MFPIAWIDEVASADDASADEWQHQVGIKVKLGNIGIIVSLTLGCITLAASFCLPLFQRSGFQSKTI